MQSFLPRVFEYLPSNARRNVIPLVSSEFYSISRQEERDLLVGLWRSYPSGTTYGSLLKAIQAVDLPRVSSFIQGYTTYLPLRWIHIIERMLWRDISLKLIPLRRDTISPSDREYNDRMKQIAFLIFERTMRELISTYGTEEYDPTKINLPARTISLLRLFVFKFGTGKMITTVQDIDTTGYSYRYQFTSFEYASVATNLPLLLENALNLYFEGQGEDFSNIIYSLILFDRDDILSTLYHKYPDDILDILESYKEAGIMFAPYGYRVIHWMKSIGLNPSPIIIDEDTELYTALLEDRPLPQVEDPTFVYRSASYNSVRSAIRGPVPSLDLYRQNPQAIAIFLSDRDNIQRVISSDQYLVPEVYLMMLESLSKGDPLYWQVIALAITSNVPEVLERYIITDVDAERAKIATGTLNPVTSTGRFFTYEWYKFRRREVI